MKSNDSKSLVVAGPLRKNTNHRRTGHKRGRPKIEIDFELAEQLAGIHCTMEEIASVLKCSQDTLRRSAEFCEVYKRGMAMGRASLRRLRWKAAQEGNASIIMFLSNIMLGEYPRTDHNVTVYKRLDEMTDEEIEVMLGERREPVTIEPEPGRRTRTN